MTRREGWAGTMLAVGFFALAWLALASPWLSGTVTIPYDAKAHFQAQIQFLANALHSGQSPFWAPNVFAGSPQIADPQSLIFSPAFLLAWFEAVPSFRAVDTYVLAMLGLGVVWGLLQTPMQLGGSMWVLEQGWPVRMGAYALLEAVNVAGMVAWCVLARRSEAPTG